MNEFHQFGNLWLRVSDIQGFTGVQVYAGLEYQTNVFMQGGGFLVSDLNPETFAAQLSEALK